MLLCKYLYICQNSFFDNLQYKRQYNAYNQME